ncbi:mycofactocin system GMC family oxidoreductase MftG [Gordonia shandongensis]|uniref:mycofactocin system GMC family oxidoreductase MftG n=1 Tax=Gordonia shandongensis TaxID=376351 RepID=UPI00042A323E|nr:mycofactocin system GMC family oxidoreductase MftG [Gordonia shandongensis]
MSPDPFATGPFADVIVVGAGSAGCVVADRLAREGTVLLLDAGPATPPPSAVTSLRALPVGPGSTRVVRYRDERGRDVVRGRGIGGSSAVNGGYFLRGHRADYRGWPWPAEAVADAFTAAERMMRVSAFADAELGTVARAFDAHWAPRGRAAEGPWTAVGLNRVRSNRVAGHRMTADRAYLGRPRRSVRVHGDAAVVGLEMRGDRVTGVRTSAGTLRAGRVVLTAGALGTAALLTPILGTLAIREHPEHLVRFEPRRAITAPALLQSVVHTADGLELRCYGDDFAAFIDGVAPTGVPVGVADLGAATTGSVRASPAGLRVDLGVPDDESAERIGRGVAAVVEMLASPAFADLVRPGSIRVDAMTGLSSHAWGTLPAGVATDAAGAVPGIDGLHVADGSVLPGPLHAGPHATIVAVASLVADRIAAG